MKLVTKASDIKSALDGINPSKIAVAYVGDNWNKYIETNQDTEIILSPTLGSNPTAIKQIAKKIGYENVFFLDNLHAKFYLGTSSALLGSCNLSNNGMGGGLHEVAVIINDIELITKLNTEFNYYKKLAQKAYPNEESKNAQIKKLTKLWERANREGIINDRQATKEVEDYEFNLNSKFHLVRCTYFDIEIKEDEYYTKDDFENYVNLLESDQDQGRIEQNEWILLIYFNKAGKFKELDWLYVDKLLSKRVLNDNPYSLLAATLKGKTNRPEPFLVKRKEVKSAIENILKTSNFPELLANDNWSIPESDVTIKFVNELQSEIKKIKA